jgi:hypothetical protein
MRRLRSLILLSIFTASAACNRSSPTTPTTPTPPLTVYEPGNGASLPGLIKYVKPNYTAAAIGGDGALGRHFAQSQHRGRSQHLPGCNQTSDPENEQ